MRRNPRPLIANEGYEVGFTKHDRPYFNARPPAGSLAAAIDDQQQSQASTNEFPWLSRCAIIPVNAAFSAVQPVVLADNYRNFLLLQNNSSGVAGTDVAPYLMFSLDGPVTANPSTTPGTPNPFALALAPGEGLLLDVRVINNALYIQWGASTNGGTLNQGGIVMYGRTPNSPPLPAGASLPSAGRGGDYQAGRLTAYSGGNIEGASTAQQTGSGYWVGR